MKITKLILVCLVSIASPIYALTPLDNHIVDLSKEYIHMCMLGQIMNAYGKSIKTEVCENEKFPQVDDCFYELKRELGKTKNSLFKIVDEDYNKNWKVDAINLMAENEKGYKEYVDMFKGDKVKACVANNAQYQTYRYLKIEEIHRLLNLK
jgi:hypothetical protein